MNRYIYACTKLHTDILAFYQHTIIFVGAISDLGPLTITLDCSTDHAIQERSINVTWLLNSTLPNYNQVPECKAYINCGNGSLKDEVIPYVHAVMQFHENRDNISRNFCGFPSKNSTK